MRSRSGEGDVALYTYQERKSPRRSPSSVMLRMPPSPAGGRRFVPLAKHAFENRIHMFQMIAQIKQLFEFGC